jgi:hypothetical protein
LLRRGPLCNLLGDACAVLGTHMLTKYDSEAEELQQSVRNTESEKDVEYDDSQIRQAIVHMREDVVLLVSYLSSLNRQLMWLRRLLWTVVALLAWLTIRGRL